MASTTTIPERLSAIAPRSAKLFFNMFTISWSSHNVTWGSKNFETQIFFTSSQNSSVRSKYWWYGRTEPVQAFPHYQSCTVRCDEKLFFYRSVFLCSERVYLSLPTRPEESKFRFFQHVKTVFDADWEACRD